MAPGFWNKIKGFFSKVGKGIKNVVGKVVGVAKPLLEKTKPLLETAGNIIGSKFGVPGAGTIGTNIVGGALDIADNAVNGKWGDAFNGAKTLSNKIRLK